MQVQHTRTDYGHEYHKVSHLDCWTSISRAIPTQTAPGPASPVAHNPSQNGLELLKINWLGQVMVESRLDAAPHVLVHSQSGERDAFQRPLSLCFSNQFVATGIGQTNITNHDVELPRI